MSSISTAPSPGEPINAAAVERILARRHDEGAARRRRARHEARSRLARNGRRARHHRHRGGEGSRLRARGRAAVSRPRSRSASTRATAASRSRAGRETSDVSALDLGRRFEDAGVAAIIYTDIARDGVLQGLNIAETVALAEALVDPRHRLGRARLDRGRQAAARARLREARRRDRRPRALRRPARSARGAGADLRAGAPMRRPRHPTSAMKLEIR